MSAGVTLSDIVMRYGGNTALDGVSLEVKPGEIHAVIGPNGAGKSTLFGVVAGEHRPTRGRVVVDGVDITHWRPHRRVRLGVARAFQVARIFPDLTVRQNAETAVLCAQRRTHVFWRPAANRKLRQDAMDGLELVGMAHLAARRGSELAQGDRKRLEIAMALSLDARLLLLDEPTAGMSPEETEATVDLVARVQAERDLTVLLTEHDMKVVFRLASVLTVLHRGQILCSGSPEEVRKMPEVVDIYLGRGHS
jgi:ABC-type branched-subunit amino acid transport system ATPase component